MAPPLRIRSDELRALQALGSIHLGPTAYYDELGRSSDVYLAVGARIHQLEAGTLKPSQWEDTLALCRYNAIRSRAFEVFEVGFEHEIAARVMATQAGTREMAESAAMRAELAFDAAAGAEAEGQLYLATGVTSHLRAASEKADVAGGWRPSLQWALRAFLIEPLSAMPLQRLYLVLDDAGQGGLLEEVAAILASRNLHPLIAEVFAASGALKRGDAEATLGRLKPLDDKRVLADKALAPYFGTIGTLRAAAEEKRGNGKAAYEGYLRVKAAEKPANVNPENFFRGTAARGALPVPELPADSRRDVVQMLGFPRSGTTLLENVLAAHPGIETFEEIPALNAAIDRIERVLLGKLPKPDDPRTTYLAARAKYYDELDRRRRKPSASVLIDKLPIRSADAAFLAKLFPDWRYIFSIRHPFDVALSCFKQRFEPNPAMENFRTIEGTARAYDHAMTEWFKRHKMDDPRVVYVRYDELVTAFEPTTRRVLEFLGLDWQDEVRDFARAAETRAAKTPSYQKVRQGLSIGVQSSWRHYGFLFHSKEAAPLKKWAEFFGYETR